MSFEKIIKYNNRFGISYSWVEHKDDMDYGHYFSNAIVNYKEDENGVEYGRVKNN